MVRRRWSSRETFRPECFEEKPVILAGSKYPSNPGGRIPIYEGTHEAYSRLSVNGVCYWLRPDIAYMYISGQLTKEQITRMV